MSRSEEGSGSGFTVGSDSGASSCGSLSVEACRRRKSNKGQIISTGKYLWNHLSKVLQHFSPRGKWEKPLNMRQK